MKFTRLVAGLTTAGLLGLSPLALSAPAHAANVTTTATLELSSYIETPITYGEDVSFSGQITGVDAATGAPDYVTAGTVSLQVSTSKSPTWTTVATDDSASSFFFSDLKPQSNALYKIVYSGGTSSTDVFSASESAPVAVSVARKMTLKNPKTTVVKIKVGPDFGKKKITVLKSKKERKGYQPFRKLKTDKAGRVTVTLPAERTRTWFALVVPGDRHYQAVSYTVSTIRRFI